MSDTSNLKLKRRGYWAWLIGIAVVHAILINPDISRMMGVTLDLTLPLLLTIAFVTYCRLLDMGWHGLWVVATLIPFFNCFIGCIRSAEDRKPKRTAIDFTRENDQGEQP